MLGHREGMLQNDCSCTAADIGTQPWNIREPALSAKVRNQTAGNLIINQPFKCWSLSLIRYMVSAGQFIYLFF